MNFPKNPSSSSSSYIPPHRTQLHPRMISLYSPTRLHTNPKPHTVKCLFFFFAFLFFTAPFLFYLFSTALQIHSSSKFADTRPAFFALALRAGPAALRVSVFHFLGPGLLAGAHSAAAAPGFAAGPDALRAAVAELVEFAKGRVPRREWGNTVVRLAAAEELQELGADEAEKVLECCRQVLRVSGFLFKDEWARVVSDNASKTLVRIEIEFMSSSRFGISISFGEAGSIVVNSGRSGHYSGGAERSGSKARQNLRSGAVQCCGPR
ncbi:putative apyrase 3, partial [Mucuna pruriens]